MEGARGGFAGKVELYVPGHAPGWAAVRMEARPGWVRAVRALVVAVLLPPAALVAFLIPPHGESLMFTVSLGIYLIYREATARWIVHAFEGACPRCARPIEMKPRARLSGRRTLPCFGCHFDIELDVARRAPEVPAAAA